MKQPDILVVTATLGNRSTLDRTINSVKTIGGDRVKHVVVAPASVCSSIKAKYPHLTVVQEPPQCKGIYNALNHGFRLFAKDHQYLTFINDDDYWYPEFRDLFDCMDHSDADVVYGRVNFVDMNGRVIKEQASSPRYQDFQGLLFREVVLFTQQATLTRSELFLRLGGFDENFKLVADTKFWLDAVKSKARFKYVNKICAAYAMHNDQLSANKALQKEEHDQLILMNEVANPFHVMLVVLFFRLWNLKIYFKRLKNKFSMN